MEKYIQGNTYARTAKVDVNTKTITIHHVTDLKDGKHYMKSVICLDKEGMEHLLVNAAYNDLIQVFRPRALKLLKSTQIDENKVLRPSDYPAGKGGGISAFEQRKQAFMEVGFEEKEAELMAAGNQDAIEKAHATIIRRRNGKDTIVKNV
uniref:Uncharacterized protein n=1 Tax=viral metagenome TaxID=1070528 RepID=A0A6M3LKA1_9ZZZZ